VSHSLEPTTSTWHETTPAPFHGVIDEHIQTRVFCTTWVVICESLLSLKRSKWHSRWQDGTRLKLNLLLITLFCAKTFNRPWKVSSNNLFLSYLKITLVSLVISNCRPQNNSPELGMQVQSMDCGLQHCPPHHLISSSYPHTPHKPNTPEPSYSVFRSLLLGLAAHADGHGWRWRQDRLAWYLSGPFDSGADGTQFSVMKQKIFAFPAPSKYYLALIFLMLPINPVTPPLPTDLIPLWLARTYLLTRQTMRICTYRKSFYNYIVMYRLGEDLRWRQILCKP